MFKSPIDLELSLYLMVTNKVIELEIIYTFARSQFSIFPSR